MHALLSLALFVGTPSRCALSPGSESAMTHANGGAANGTDTTEHHHCPQMATSSAHVVCKRGAGKGLDRVRATDGALLTKP